MEVTDGFLASLFVFFKDDPSYYVENRLGTGASLRAGNQAGGYCSSPGEKLMAAWIKMVAVSNQDRRGESLGIFWNFTIILLCQDPSISDVYLKHLDECSTHRRCLVTDSCC